MKAPSFIYHRPNGMGSYSEEAKSSRGVKYVVIINTESSLSAATSSILEESALNIIVLLWIKSFERLLPIIFIQ